MLLLALLLGGGRRRSVPQFGRASLMADESPIFMHRTAGNGHLAPVPSDACLECAVVCCNSLFIMIPGITALAKLGLMLFRPAFYSNFLRLGAAALGGYLLLHVPAVSTVSVGRSSPPKQNTHHTGPLLSRTVPKAGGMDINGWLATAT